MWDNFAARLKQSNWASKNDIAVVVKKNTGFDDKLKNINKKVTSNKTRYTELNKKTRWFSKKS